MPATHLTLTSTTSFSICTNSLSPPHSLNPLPVHPLCPTSPCHHPHNGLYVSCCHNHQLQEPRRLGVIAPIAQPLRNVLLLGMFPMIYTRQKPHLEGCVCYPAFSASMLAYTCMHMWVISCKQTWPSSLKHSVPEPDTRHVVAGNVLTMVLLASPGG